MTYIDCFWLNPLDTHRHAHTWAAYGCWLKVVISSKSSIKINIYLCFFSLQLWEVYGDRRCLRTFIGNASFFPYYNCLERLFKLFIIINHNFSALIWIKIFIDLSWVLKRRWVCPHKQRERTRKGKQQKQEWYEKPCHFGRTSSISDCRGMGR